MKKITLLILFFVFSYGNSQELMNFYLSPFTATSDGSITLHTTFFAYSGAGIVNYEYTIEDNIVHFRLCYAVGSSSVNTLDKQTFEIELPLYDGDYTFNIDLYTDYNGQTCNYINSTNSGSINFTMPYHPTEKIEISDPAFESYLEYLGFGDNVFDNGFVFKHKTENAISLYLSDNYFEMDGEIESLASIKHFKSLKNLFCYDFNLSNINLSYNSELEFLYCDNNPLVNFDVSDNPKLKKLWCRGIDLNQLDLSNNPLLEDFAFSSNLITDIDLTDKFNLIKLELNTEQLGSLDLSNNLLLERLKITNTSITTLDLSNNNLLNNLVITYNEFLTELDLSTLINIQDMFCYGNIIEELDLSLNTNLSQVRLSSNNLNYLNIKNGNNEDIYEINTLMNPNLLCIEVDSDGESQPFDYSIDSQTYFSENCTEPEPLFDIDGINQPATSFYLYPNPAKDILFIETQKQNIGSIKIINLQGVLVKEVEETSRIDISNLASGLYFAQIFSEGNSITKKFIKK